MRAQNSPGVSWVALGSAGVRGRLESVGLFQFADTRRCASVSVLFRCTARRKSCAFVSLRRLPLLASTALQSVSLVAIAVADVVM